MPLTEILIFLMLCLCGLIFPANDYAPVVLGFSGESVPMPWGFLCYEKRAVRLPLNIGQP